MRKWNLPRGCCSLSFTARSSESNVNGTTRMPDSRPTRSSLSAQPHLRSSLKRIRANQQSDGIAAGVVSGIGFIGGGVIMRRGASVQGINSAATLWAAAAMGLAIGGGYYALGTLITAVILSARPR